MTRIPPKDVGAAVRARLLRLARERGEDFQAVLTRCQRAAAVPACGIETRSPLRAQGCRTVHALQPRRRGPNRDVDRGHDRTQARGLLELVRLREPRHTLLTSNVTELEVDGLFLERELRSCPTRTSVRTGACCELSRARADLAWGTRRSTTSLLHRPAYDGTCAHVEHIAACDSRVWTNERSEQLKPVQFTDVFG
jgi:hypothetical protein